MTKRYWACIPLFFWAALSYATTAPITPTITDIYQLTRSPQIEGLSTGDKMVYFSRLFIDGQYPARMEWGPLGEGKFCDYNCKPLYRFDAFDCTTFVEMVLALSTTDTSGDPGQTMKSFESRVIEIRYKDPKNISYLTRNHFPSADWIPHNTRLGGLLTDVTANLGVTPTLTPPALIDRKNWYAHKTLSDICVFDDVCSAPRSVQEEKLYELKEAGQSAHNESVTMFYLPVEKVLANKGSALSQIPNGSIIQFVRPNWSVKGITHMHVSHQGIVVQDGKGTWLHHASSAEEEMSRVLLSEYLKDHRRCGKTMVPESCAQGISVLRPT